MRRGMAGRAGRMVAGLVSRMAGRRFITAAGIGGARMGMAWGWEAWDMATRGMGGWMRMIRDMTRATIRDMTLVTTPETLRGTETTGHTMLGRIRMDRV